MHPLPRKATVYLWAVVGLAAIALPRLDPGLPRQDLSFYLLLSGVALVAVVRPVTLFYGSTMDVGTGILLAILTLHGTGPAVLTAAAAKTLHGLIGRWRPERLAFNIAQHVLSLGLAGLVLKVSQTYGLELAGVLTAPLVYGLLQSGLVARIIALSQDLTIRQVWAENYRPMMLPFLTLAVMGAMTGFSIRQEAWQVGLLLIVLAGSYLGLRLSWLLRLTAEQARQSQLLNRVLAQLNEQAEGRVDLGLVLKGAAEMMGAVDGWVVVQDQAYPITVSDPFGRGEAQRPTCRCCTGDAPAPSEPVFSHQGTGSQVCVPLLVSDSLVACLNLQSAQRMSAERLGPGLRSLAQQVSGVMEKAWLYQRERDRARALHSLMETVHNINAQLSLERVLDRIVGEAVKVFQAEVAAILLDGPDGGLSVRAGSGLADDPAVHQQLAEAVQSALGTDGEALQLQRSDGQLEDAAWRQVRPELGSALLLPLREAGRPVGVLAIGSISGSRRFRDSEVELALSLASAAATAVRKAELYEALEDREQRLRDFLDRLIRAQEEERKMVAYDIHDGLLQYIIAAAMHLGAFEGQTPQGWPWEEDLQRGLERLQSAIKEGRRVISDLRPSTLDDFGLVDTLHRHLDRLAQETGWHIQMQESLNGVALPPTMETTIFRIVQEALNNVQKHAHSDRVAVDLARQNGEVRVRVQDWGRGFDPQAVGQGHRGLGLSAIRERADLMGGWSRIESRPGQGTVVEVGLPLAREVGKT